MTRRLSIRMYDVGFGDCFVVTVADGPERWRMLVDCGVHSQGRARPIEEVVAAVVDQLEQDPGTTGRARLDVVVATHRHADHVSGFAEDAWRAVEVGEVWLPYLEDPDDPTTRDFAGRTGLAASRLLTALELRLAAVSSKRVAAARDLAALALSNEPAMDRLHGRNGAQFANRPPVRFLPAADPAANVLDPAPGVRVHVLGPSRDPAFLRRMNPPRSAGWLRLDDETEPVGPLGEIFAPRFRVDAADVPPGLKDPQHLGRLDNLTDEDGLLQAAFRIDRVVNNTSVFLVLEVDDVRVILPGDAQQGAWDAVRADPANRALFRDAQVYKIGHHGSHNATPRAFVEEDWEAAGYALLPWGEVARWPTIPAAGLIDALTAGHRVLSAAEPFTDAHVPARTGPWTEVVFDL